MPNLALRIFLFALINLGLFFLHLTIFRGSYPFLAWFTGLVHLGVLLMLPYQKLFRS